MANVKCPHCGSQIDIDNVMEHEIRARLEMDYKRKKEEFEKQKLVDRQAFETELNEKRLAYIKADNALKARENAVNEKIQAGINLGISAEREKLVKESKEWAARENQATIKALNEELDKKSKQVSELNLIKAELDKEKRAKLELETEYKAKTELEISNRIKEILEENQLKIRDKDEQIKMIIEQSSQKLLEEKQQIESENAAKFEILQKELQEKSQRISELNLIKAEMEAQKRKFNELEAENKAKSEIELTNRVNQERERLSKQISQENELKFRQKDEQIQSLIGQINELKRRSEVGSQQLQGEVQELALQEYLRLNFPFDEIDEVKKGARGADCVQMVHTREFVGCGKILYESKRTKSFEPKWIDKLKDDMIGEGAQIGVIVTEQMPPHSPRLHQAPSDASIWICSFEEFKGLCAVLREHVVALAFAKRSGQNQDSKTAMLYDYLTSPEFANQIKTIVSAFVGMQESLNKERNAMERIWKQREKQIARARDGAIAMHASIRSIAGSGVAQLEDVDEILSLEAIAAEGEASALQNQDGEETP